MTPKDRAALKAKTALNLLTLRKYYHVIDSIVCDKELIRDTEAYWILCSALPEIDKLIEHMESRS